MVFDGESQFPVVLLDNIAQEAPQGPQGCVSTVGVSEDWVVAHLNAMTTVKWSLHWPDVMAFAI